MAEGGSGSGHVERELGVRLRRGAHREVFKHSRHAAAMTEFLENPDALTIETEGFGIAALIAAQTCQVGKHARNAPLIPKEAKRRETLFAIRTRRGEVRSFSSDVAQVVQGPCGSGSVSGFAEHDEALIIKSGRARIFASQFHHVGKIAESTGNIGGVAKVFPDGNTSLEE